ncbi:MAG: isoleucine--tRNA ligase [Firmicutes bacterium]|nr:isoleucine--tRNA ligase [Bacillota bacterium]
MYEKIDPSLNFAEREQSIIKFWQENRIFEKSIENRADGKDFTFYDGPPTANGKPHIGHILTRVMKDLIPRYQTMKGKRVLRKAGWDTHGLPVELEVEKVLGFDGKQDIEKFGVEPFIKACKESVWKYQAEWEKMSARVGYWVDMDKPYITYTDEFIESVWWSIAEIFNKGLIYKGHKIVPYCPRCGTALSSHEVAQGYKDIEEMSCVVKFKAAQTDIPTYILAWTTTPWTLPSNTALCFHPDHDYACIEANSERFILANALIGKHFKEGEYTVIDVKKGSEYQHFAYEPLYNFHTSMLSPKDKAHYVTTDTFVTLNDGTGVVHIAPAFGEDDAAVGRRYNLPFIQLVGADGKFIAEAGQFAGVFCKDADKTILGDLAARGLLRSKIPFAHSYPFCWRCHKPLIYYARSSWFIKMTAVKEELLKNNASVNWIPDTIKHGRMGNFLENVVDWGISRERYWGTPLPIWVCGACGKTEACASKAQLKKRGGIKGKIELHKPYVDAVVFTCTCGGKMSRTPEVVDCWYDSGAMPFAQWHYPFENKEMFTNTFPADFISEAVDQTRGWFYTLLAISTLLFNRAPFKNCIVLGHVNDKDGRKMSKHLGNVVDPWQVLDTCGADAVRWYFYTSCAPWLPSRFYPEAVAEAQRKFLGTLWNVCSFYALYAKIDAFNPAQYDLKKCKLTLMDKWILSELHSLTDYIDTCLAEYKITESARKIEEFTDALSNWYVRRCRERFWGKGMESDKISAYMTLYTVLQTLSKLIAPYVPFIAESIHQSFVRPFGTQKESVHLYDFPVSDKKRVDKNLESEMRTVLSAAALGRAARSGASIKNRQPLSKLYLAGSEIKELSDALKSVLADELNVKEVEIVRDTGGFVDYEVKPQLKTLGPKYGKRLNEIRTHMAANAQAIVEAVNAGGEYRFSAAGEEVSLSGQDVLISAKNKEGFATESANALAVILDTRLTAELIEEGFVRELISKIQSLRKDSGFEVTDRIALTYGGDPYIEEIFTKFGGKIASATLADTIQKSSAGTVCELNGKTARLGVTKK